MYKQHNIVYIITLPYISYNMTFYTKQFLSNYNKTSVKHKADQVCSGSIAILQVVQ